MTDPPARILLIEDNDEMASGIHHNLDLEGYEVRRAADGAAGLEAGLEGRADLIILDIMLPRMDGFQVLKNLRANGVDIPILILTARGEEADKVRGFRLDADQYLTKPFGLLELLERVRRLLRRSADPEDMADTVIEFGDVVVNTPARLVTKAGSVVSLTPRAYDLLLCLAAHEGRVLTRQDLLREVWGHLGMVVTRTVDSHISELRTKLEDDPSQPSFIHTVWKVGYRFQP